MPNTRGYQSVVGIDPPCRLLYGQNHLPNIFPVVDVLMSRRALGQRKRLTDRRFDLSRAVHPEQFLHLAPQYRAASLQV